jgi:DNA-binding transcriptional LysR family regulator
MTREGAMYLGTGSKLQELERMVSSSRDIPRGLLKVNATFGFGRRHIVPALSEFTLRYPEVEVQLDLTDRPLSLAESAYDVGIRFGELPDSRLIEGSCARHLSTSKSMVLLKCQTI